MCPTYKISDAITLSVYRGCLWTPVKVWMWRFVNRKDSSMQNSVKEILIAAELHNELCCFTAVSVVWIELPTLTHSQFTINFSVQTLSVLIVFLSLKLKLGFRLQSDCAPAVLMWMAGSAIVLDVSGERKLRIQTAHVAWRLQAAKWCSGEVFVFPRAVPNTVRAVWLSKTCCLSVLIHREWTGSEPEQATVEPHHCPGDSYSYPAWHNVVIFVKDNQSMCCGNSLFALESLYHDKVTARDGYWHSLWT